MIDVTLEARQFAAEAIRHLLGGGRSSEAVGEVECELYGAASILSRLGHARRLRFSVGSSRICPRCLRWNLRGIERSASCMRCWRG